MQGDSGLVTVRNSLKGNAMGTRDAGRGTSKTSPLLEARRIQHVAAMVGFDWPDIQGPVAKVKEELAEVEREEGSGKREALEEEIGDLLFAVVNLARKLGIDPDAALARANKKFKRRFKEVEKLAQAQGMKMGRASLEELDRLWDETKATEGRKHGRGTQG